MRACAHHSNSAFHRAPTVMIATSVQPAIERGAVPERRAEIGQLSADGGCVQEGVERPGQAAARRLQPAAAGADHGLPDREGFGG